MSPVSIISLVAMTILAAYAVTSDIRTGMVKNSILMPFAAFAIVLDVVSYGFLDPGLALSFLSNASTVSVFSLLLFCTKTWAGGDLKLACTMALLYPAEMYSEQPSQFVTLFLAIVVALVSGWLFAVIRSICTAPKNGHHLTLRDFANKFYVFLSSYVRVVLYLAVINGLLMLALPGIAGDGVPLMPFICFCVAWLVNCCEAWKSRWLFVAAFFTDVVLALLLGRLPIATSPVVYAMVLIATALRLISIPGQYKYVETQDVREGMILSFSSTALMSTSHMKGLPSISTEGLDSRLTSGEAESVRRWGKSARGAGKVSIVVKTPFAPFVCLGFAAYAIFWSLS